MGSWPTEPPSRIVCWRGLSWSSLANSCLWPSNETMHESSLGSSEAFLGRRTASAHIPAGEQSLDQDCQSASRERYRHPTSGRGQLMTARCSPSSVSHCGTKDCQPVRRTCCHLRSFPTEEYPLRNIPRRPRREGKRCAGLL